MKIKKKALCAALTLALLLGFFASAGKKAPSYCEEAQIDLSGIKSALLMEADSGKVLFECNADERLPPASVTKIMTLLLVMEEVDGGRLPPDEKIVVSREAAHMGGSQVYLEEGEEMTAAEMIKCVVIASANDAAAALAERVGGTLENFVSMMNARAKELGMEHTHFENTNGLDDTTSDHLTTARDIALMSRELLKHEKIFDYTTVWMDTVRDGAFGLTNTNRLIRFYKGANGLKTGSTAKAGFCISATAKRDGMQLIAVIMGAPTRDVRNSAAAKLLDYGFARFETYRFAGDRAEIPVTGGRKQTLIAEAATLPILLKKGESAKVVLEKELPLSVGAPVEAGQKVGEAVLRLDGAELARVPYAAAETVGRMTFSDLLAGLFGAYALF